MMTTAATRLERRPHQATRAVVETLGTEAPRALYRAFDAYNAAHFAGQLGAPLLFVTQTSSPRAFGDYIGRDLHGLRSRIRIAPRAVARGERFALDVLLHELVHAWQSEIDGSLEDGYKGHGPRFAAKCNEIGKALGLPEVGVKGRHGLPDCAQWPICVRPAGYYPPAPPRRRARRVPAAGRSTPPKGRGRAGGDESAAVLAALVAEAVDIVRKVPDKPRQAFGLDAWLTRVGEALS